jgi:hypothetical protein
MITSLTAEIPAFFQKNSRLLQRVIMVVGG